jgi:putative transposase
MEGRYEAGAHTVYDIKYHFVWKTKYGYGVLKGDVALRTRQILREICAEQGIGIVSGNVRANHVHMMVSGPTNISPAQIAQYLKGKSSHRLQREFRELQKRYWGQHLWARGYFCATVGAVNEEMIKKYIENQTEEEGSFKVWDVEPKTEEKSKGALGRFICWLTGFSLSSRIYAAKQSTGFSR